MEILLKYKDLLGIAANLFSSILIFIVGWKGIDTVNKYQRKKQIDLEYEQLHEFNLIFSKMHSLFIQFNQEFITFEYELIDKKGYSVYKLDIFNDKLEQLKSVHTQLNETSFKCHLLNLNFTDINTYMFVLSDYIYGHSKILVHLKYKNVLPYEIELKNEYFQSHFVFQEKLTDPIFDLFNSIKENIRNYKID